MGFDTDSDLDGEMRIVADSKIPFLGGALESRAEVVYLPGADISAADVADADALIVRTRTNCGEKLLSGSKVKFIATATIGFDHIDAAYCAANGIEWTNAPGCNSGSVRQYICSVLLNLAVRHGFSLKGKTIGVVGVGNVGAKIAELGETLGMRVLLDDPPRARVEGGGVFVDLKRIVAESDIITLHTPLAKDGGDKTWHLADAGFISAMKRSAFLINSSRGEVVDNQALKTALKEGRLAGAVLDVWEGEPEIDLELLELVDIATPHIAGYSLDGKANGTAMSVQAVSRFLGLGLDDWMPENVTAPANPVLPGVDATDEAALLAAVSSTYDVLADDRRLRGDPAGFERQRGDYPLRREFRAFSVENADETLVKLGFNHV